MPVPMKQFTLGPLQFSRGCRHGFVLNGAGALALDPSEGTHIFVFRRFDSAEPGGEWGRFVLRAELSPENSLLVLAYASDSAVLQSRREQMDLNVFFSDPAVSGTQKRSMFRRLGGISASNAEDLLLYPLRGRYLWILAEVTGNAPAVLHGGRLIATKQSFINALPEVYRSADGDFLERYLSVFSSLYLDLQKRIDTVGELVSLDTAPDEMLPVFSRWLGIRAGTDLLPPVALRRLLREGYGLARWKGTRAALCRAAAFLLDETPRIVEQAAAMAYPCASAQVLRRLYGGSPFDVTVLIRQKPDERLHARLLFLLNQFKPARARLRILFLTARSALDAHCYLDYNARCLKSAPVALDGGGLGQARTLL